MFGEGEMIFCCYLYAFALRWNVEDGRVFNARCNIRHFQVVQGTTVGFGGRHQVCYMDRQAPWREQCVHTHSHDQDEKCWLKKNMLKVVLKKCETLIVKLLKYDWDWLLRHNNLREYGICHFFLIERKKIAHDLHLNSLQMCVYVGGRRLNKHISYFQTNNLWFLKIIFIL